MFDLGWQEFILIALVAVVVVGPKDLPRVIRTVGQWIRKARSLASEFQGSLEEMAREAELDDVRKQVQQVSREGIGASIEKHVDPGGDIRRSIDDARASSGADEIQGAIDEARRDTQALANARDDAGKVDATAGETVGRYESLAAKTRIPDNSVVPPADAPAAETAAEPAGAKPSGHTPAATKADGAPKAAKAPAKRTAAKPAEAPAKPAAKPKRAVRKTAATDAGEA